MLYLLIFFLIQIHPDRLSNFAQATKAFQSLVTAYDRLTNPPKSEVESRPNKGNLLERSNSGCFRTVVKCPRCHQIWGTPVQGLEPYSYNYLMIGLKSYTCSTCLCGILIYFLYFNFRIWMHVSRT